MSLTTEEIVQNAKKYFETAESVGAMSPELFDYIGLKITDAPATPSEDNFFAYKGGLIAYLLLIAKHAVNLNNQLPPEIRVEKNKLLKVCLLSQIAKADMFEEDPNPKYKQPYRFVDNPYPIKTAEKSVFLAQNYGVKLELDEYYAIINPVKNENGYTPLATILECAIRLATLEAKQKTIKK